MTQKDLSTHLDTVEKRLDEHIRDGIGVWTAIEQVKNDLAWIKRAFWLLVGIALSLGAFLVKFELFRVLHNG